MEPGALALVNYGENPPHGLWHVRVLLSHVTGNNWVILTPDYDRYEEQLDHLNPDYVDFEYVGVSGQIPARIPANRIYRFAPMDPGFLADHMRQARLEADAIRASRGIGPPAAAPHPVPVVGQADSSRTSASALARYIGSWSRSCCSSCAAVCCSSSCSHLLLGSH